MPDPVVEIAVYKIPPDAIVSFLAKQPAAHAAMKQFEGFRSIRSLRSIEDPSTFADYCEWESYDHAIEAGKRAMTMPEFAVFFELGDGMVSFLHYRTHLKTEKS